MISNIIKSARGRAGNVFDYLDALETRRLVMKVNKVLSQPDPPRQYDEEAFWALQGRYSWRGFKYDDYSAWSRASERVVNMLNEPSLQMRGKQVLEIGCGDGMTGLLMSVYGHQVSLNDIEDWRTPSAFSLHFERGDIGSGLALESDTFDLIYSFNVFEHILDPRGALKEMVRLVKPGGLIYLNFGPLYYSPWGLHAYKTIFMPYLQILFSQEFLAIRLHELGIHDLGQWREELQPLNKWRLDQYEDLWAGSGCEVIKKEKGIDLSQLPVVCKYPDAFSGGKLSFDDLVTSGIEILLRIP